MNKRLIVIILVGLLILAGIIGLLYYSANQDQPTNQQSTLQSRKVLDEEAKSPIASLNNQSLWFFNSEGRLFATDTNGSNLSEFPLPNTIPNLKRILWPKLGYDFIAIWGDDVISKSYYDSMGKVFINLSENIQYIDWLPDGKRVVYVWKSDSTHQQLVTANADGTGYKTITDVFWPDLVLKAGNDGKTVLMYRSNPGDVNKIYAANLDTGKIETLVDLGKNTSAAWISEKEFLFQRDGKIYSYNIANKKTSDLNLNTTLDRVAADSTGQILYANIDGKFVKINLSNINTENYFEPDSKIQVKNILLVGSTVYYTDSADNKLYMIGK